MAYQIEYAYTCHIGKVRNNNEDNFWCCGESLDSENKGMSHVCSGHIKQADLPLLAVFDGMGGESCGEMAAFLAAESCGQYYKEKKKEFSEDPEQFMNGLCSTMNHAVCHYGKENKINSMGTTAAMLAFGKENVYSCNLYLSDLIRGKTGAAFARSCPWGRKVWKAPVDAVSWYSGRKYGT